MGYESNLMSFKKNKYTVLKNVISKELAKFVTDYLEFILRTDLC